MSRRWRRPSWRWRSTGFGAEVAGDLDRAVAAHGQHSQAGKILEIHQELPGRIHLVLIRQQTGF